MCPSTSCSWGFGDLQTLGWFWGILLLLLMEEPSTPFPGHLSMAGRQLHTWSACLDPLLCPGMALVMHQHLFLISSGTAGLWDQADATLIAGGECVTGLQGTVRLDLLYQRCFNNPKSASQK